MLNTQKPFSEGFCLTAMHLFFSLKLLFSSRHQRTVAKQPSLPELQFMSTIIIPMVI